MDELHQLLERVKQGMIVVDTGISKGEKLTDEQLDKAILLLRKLMLQLTTLGHELGVNWQGVLMETEQIKML